eukprot:m.44584 g.44584  ORF g.44584 m.44584 type:complete len:346 (+) comp14569_c0_seq1:28-1065(+)
MPLFSVPLGFRAPAQLLPPPPPAAPPAVPPAAAAGSSGATSASAGSTSNSNANRNKVVYLLLGGCASMMAVCCTHPLDLLKVRLQTTVTVAGTASDGAVGTAVKIVKVEGITGLYRGLSAALLRQAMYSTTRFAAYDVIKDLVDPCDGKPLATWRKVVAGMGGGAIGVLVGNPGDVANVRMQADGRLAPAQRRNYRHCFDALGRIRREEGLKMWYSGLLPNIQRGMLVTVGQLASYDEFKYLLLTKTGGLFKDNMLTHFTASTLAGAVATLLTQPVDVVKTRVMTSEKGRYSSAMHCLVSTVRGEGPLALFKGFTPSLVRLGPHTVLTFVFLEQLRQLHTYLTAD